MELALRSLFVDESIGDRAIARRRAASLFDGTVDHFFHYHGDKQAALWLDVHKTFAPLFQDSAYVRIFHDLFAEIVPAWGGHAVHVVSLGPGGGQKEALLLQALIAANRAVRYTPIDASVELALRSAQQAPAGCEAQPVAADLSNVAALRPWLDRRSGPEPRIVTAFGVAPNFTPRALRELVHDVMRDGDVLLLSANLAGVDEAPQAYAAACAALLRQYENQPTIRWLQQICIDWEIDRHLSTPSFEIGSIDGVSGFFAVSRWLADVAFDWEGHAFTAARGDALRLFFSLRYTPGRLAAALAPANLILGRGRVTPDAHEGVWPVTRRSRVEQRFDPAAE